ncbi:MAG: hypothetical protein IJY56_00210 [Clostridia bacterium]|nr:hypothetical protein [Clostridia bacterium]
MKSLRKSVSRILAFTLALCLVLLTGCGSSSEGGVSSVTSQNTPASSEAIPEVSSAATSSEEPISETSKITTYTRVLGRHTPSSSGIGLALSWTNSGIEFTFEGTAAYADIISTGGNTLMGVFVDGEKTHSSTFVANASVMTTQTLVKDLPEGTHTVKLLKLTETKVSLVSISKIKVDGSGIRPAEAKKRSIEVIGDSITCAFGSLAPAASAPFKNEEEDGSLSYAFLAAQHFDADVNFISRSGIGVAYNNGGDQNDLMPDVYKSTMYFAENTKTVWSESAAYKPNDVVVINLGANDAHHVPNNAARTEEFTNAFIGLMKNAREYNPDAYIIVCYGTIRYQIQSIVSAAVDKYKAETKDKKATFFSFGIDHGTVAGGTLAGHPSPIVQEMMAEKLIDEIEKVTGWN